MIQIEQKKSKNYNKSTFKQYLHQQTFGQLILQLILITLKQNNKTYKIQNLFCKRHQRPYFSMPSNQKPQQHVQKALNQHLQGQQLEASQNVNQSPQPEQGQPLTQADKKVYAHYFSSLDKINKKLVTAKSKMSYNQTQKQTRNINFKQIAEKIIQSKQNSEIVNKEDLLTDINQSFQRAVIDVYTENQKLKKKMADIEKVVKEQNAKIYQHKTKQQVMKKEIQQLRFQLAQNKDQHLVNNRGPKQAVQQSRIKQQSKRPNNQKTSQNQNEDFDFWNSPQNQPYGKKKKQFVQNSGLWVNQKNTTNQSSVFVTQGRSR